MVNILEIWINLIWFIEGIFYYVIEATNDMLVRLLMIASLIMLLTGVIFEMDQIDLGNRLLNLNLNFN